MRNARTTLIQSVDERRRRSYGGRLRRLAVAAALSVTSVVGGIAVAGPAIAEVATYSSEYPFVYVSCSPGRVFVQPPLLSVSNSGDQYSWAMVVQRWNAQTRTFQRYLTSDEFGGLSYWDFHFGYQVKDWTNLRTGGKAGSYVYFNVPPGHYRVFSVSTFTSHPTNNWRQFTSGYCTA